MSNYLVDGADLTSIANAIRTKGGTSAQLAFPQGFVDAVDAIPTGITPTGTKQISITANGTTTEDVSSYANAEISVNVPVGWTTLDVAKGTAPSGRIELTQSFTVAQYALCKRPITALFAPNATMSNAACQNCISLKTAVYGKMSSTTQFSGCTSLEAADQQSAGGLNAAFNGCTKMSILVLRNASSVVVLSNVNAFNNTPFASGKAGGTLYVPQALIESYQAATNWSTILGYANNQIKSIESTATDPNAPVDLTTHYIDGTPIPTT